MSETYDVYLGESAESLVQIASGISELSLEVPEEDRLAKTVETWYWRVDATNENGTTEGDVWQFTPYWIPEITSQSGDQAVASGTTVNLFVTAVGSPTLRYQWFKDGVPIDGETESTLSISVSNTSTFTCAVFN